MNKTFAFIIGLIILSSCALQEAEQRPSAEIVDKIKSAQKIDKSIEFKLTKTKITPKTFRVSLDLSNPEKREINSVRTWLSYNPEDLKIIKIETQDSDFNLAAPGENEYDAEAGLIKIGRSQTNGVRQKSEMKVAEIMLEKTQTGSVILDFYNYHENQDGHINANILFEGRVYNLAAKPDSPGLIIE